MLPSMMSAQPFVRKRYPRVLDHGNLVVDESATPDEATFYGSVQPGMGATDLVNRDGAEVVYTIYAGPSADVQHYDLVDFNFRTYQVSSAPERWQTGILDHIVIHLSRWAG